MLDLAHVLAGIWQATLAVLGLSLHLAAIGLYVFGIVLAAVAIIMVLANGGAALIAASPWRRGRS